MSQGQRIMPWQVEGSEFRQPLFQTDAIALYLDPSKLKRSLAFLGPKGSGKTLLLREKFQSLRDNQSEWAPSIFPRDNFREVIDPNTWGIYKEERDVILDPEYWCELWISAMVTVAAHSEQKALPKAIMHLFSPDNPPLSVLSVLSTWFASSLRGKLRQIRADLANDVINTMASLTHDYCFFLDDVDEISTTHKKHAVFQWRVTQRGLLLAMYKLAKRTRRIRVFTTLRPQALYWSGGKDWSPELNIQLQDLVAPLEYTKSDLLSVFKAHCEATERKFMVEPEAKDPVRAFLGRDTVRLTSSSESAMSFIWRHTLGRPRDIISIGSKLMTSSRKDDDEFRNTVNVEGASIFSAYVWEIFKGYVSAVQNGFSLVPSNVVYSHELEVIDDIVELLPVAQGDQTVTRWSAHVAAAGLLGHPRPSTDNEWRLHFERAGRHNFPDEGVALNPAPFYVIHPCAYHYLRASRPHFTEFSVALAGAHSGMVVSAGASRNARIRAWIVSDVLHVTNGGFETTVDLRSHLSSGLYLASIFLLHSRRQTAKAEAITAGMGELALSTGHSVAPESLWIDGPRGNSGTFSNNGVLKAAKQSLSKAKLKLKVLRDAIVLAGVEAGELDCYSLSLLCLRASSFARLSERK